MIITKGNLALDDLKQIGLADKGIGRSEYTLSQRQKILSHYSTTAKYNDDEWFIDKKESAMNYTENTRTLSFGGFPNNAKDYIKDWVLDLIQSGRKLKGIQSKIAAIELPFNIIGDVPVERISARDIMRFYDTLIGKNLGISTSNNYWNTFKIFFEDMGFDKQAALMSTYILPRPEHRKCKKKYIPEEAIKQLDVLFISDELPLTYRCIYWTLRLFPNRLEEVLSIPINALKKVSEDAYTLSIPVNKTAGTFDLPEDKIIKILYKGMGKFYIDLLQEQIDFTTKNMPKSEFLFVTCKYMHVKTCGFRKANTKRCYVVDINQVNYFFSVISSSYDIKDDKGNRIKITSHMFRHNSVTDRLRSGVFERIDVMPLTGHKNLTMIDKNYYHAPEPEERPVEFRGKITENQRKITMILARPFAKEIYGFGVCSDIRDCKNGKISCLKCPHFNLDERMLPFMKKDRDDWMKKYDKAVKIGNDSFTNLCKEWIDAYDAFFEREVITFE